MIVLGADPSISSTGLVLLGAMESRFGRIQTAERTDSLTDRADRINESVDETLAWLGRSLISMGDVNIDLIAYEAPAYRTTNGFAHMLAGHWWFMADALRTIAPLVVVASGTLKVYATNDGRATKQKVHKAAVAAYPTRVPKDFKNGNDIGDASVLATMAAEYAGLMDYDALFPAGGKRALKSVKWPELRGVRHAA